MANWRPRRGTVPTTPARFILTLDMCADAQTKPHRTMLAIYARTAPGRSPCPTSLWMPTLDKRAIAWRWRPHSFRKKRWVTAAATTINLETCAAAAMCRRQKFPAEPCATMACLCLTRTTRPPMDGFARSWKPNISTTHTRLLVTLGRFHTMDCSVGARTNLLREFAGVCAVQMAIFPSPIKWF